MVGVFWVFCVSVVLASFLKRQQTSQQTPLCTCDCCLTQEATPDDAASEYQSGLKCSVAQLTSTSLVEGSCLSDTCVTNLSEFDGPEETLQYSHYCYDTCAPVRGSNAVDIQCVDKGDKLNAETVPTAAKSNPSPTGRTGTSEPMRAPGVNLVRSSAKAQHQEMTVGAAKSQMMQAYTYAKAAGLAAMHSKVAYERMVGNVRIMSEKAGKTVMDEIKREAREQSTRAKEKHAAFVKAAQDGAIAKGKAIGAEYRAKAATYKTAHEALAKSAALYSLAASQRERLAEDWMARVKISQSVKDPQRVQQNMLQYKQAADQATQFAATAATVQKQADQAAAGEAFFTGNEPVASEFELEANLPPGIDRPLPGTY